MIKVTFPHMGYYGIAFKAAFKELGWKVIMPPMTNKRAIELGVRHSPEYICFPFKVNIGNIMQALEQGADTILMFSSGGACRFSYYGLLQKKILQKTNKKIRFYIFGGKHGIKDLTKVNNDPLIKILNSFRHGWKKIKLIEYVEDLSWKTRPRETKKGETSNVMKKCMAMIDKATKKNIASLKKKLKKEFDNIKTDKKRKILKMGVVGEIYTVLDPYVNQEIDEVLGNLGVEISRMIRLSVFLKHTLTPKIIKKIIHQKSKYLNEEVGGHGLYTIQDTEKYIKKKFNGIVHILPFGCMPEISIKPILLKLGKDKKIPILSLSVDEQTGKGGIITRIEAFIDMIRGKNEESIPWN